MFKCPECLGQKSRPFFQFSPLGQDSDNGTAPIIRLSDYQTARCSVLPHSPDRAVPVSSRPLSRLAPQILRDVYSDMLSDLSRFLSDAQGVDPGQLEQMWKLLDDMAANNPGEYEKLIHEAKEDAATRRVQASFVPQPNFVISGLLETVEPKILATASAGRAVAELFVNVCTAEKCLGPNRGGVEVHDASQVADCTVPFSVGVRREDCKGQVVATRVVYDVVVNPLTTTLARKDERFKRFIATIILARLVKTEQPKFPNSSLRDGSVTFPAISYKSGKQPQPHCLEFHCDRESQKTLRSPKAQPQQRPQAPAAPAAAAPLIEELASEEEVSVCVSGGRDWMKSVTVSVLSQKQLRIAVAFQTNTDICSAVDVEEFPQEHKVVLLFGGYEPLEISSLPFLLGRNSDCNVSKKKHTLELIFEKLC